MRVILEMARSLGLEAFWDGEKVVLSAPKPVTQTNKVFVPCR
jgi:inactivated superfamily I helicase